MNRVEMAEIGLGNLLRWFDIAAAANTKPDPPRPVAKVPPVDTPASTAPGPPPAASRASPPATKDKTLEDLAARARGCQDCKLCQSRTQVVFGVGEPKPGGLMIIGEGPGEQEDLQGEPFVGKAGQLLDAMLAAIGLQRGKDVYITNMVKCRPPKNRDPTATEIARCMPYLEQQVKFIKPSLLVATGRVAATSLLASEQSITKLRGQVHKYLGVPLVAMYHPSYLLRRPSQKLKAWDDLRFISKEFRRLRESI